MFLTQYLELYIEVSQAAAHSALQHLIVVVVCIAEGLLVALQGSLEDTETQEAVAHAQAYLAIELEANSCPLHV